MTVVPLNAVSASLIEKVAADNGFDLGPVPDGVWLRFASTQCPLRVAVGAATDGGFLAALSLRNVADELASLGSRTTAAMPAEQLRCCKSPRSRTCTDSCAAHSNLLARYQTSCCTSSNGLRRRCHA
jgi:hypothetical protein